MIDAFLIFIILLDFVFLQPLIDQNWLCLQEHSFGTCMLILVSAVIPRLLLIFHEFVFLAQRRTNFSGRSPGFWAPWHWAWSWPQPLRFTTFTWQRKTYEVFSSQKHFGVTWVWWNCETVKLWMFVLMNWWVTLCVCCIEAWNIHVHIQGLRY